MLLPMFLLKSGTEAVVESLSFGKDVVLRLVSLGIRPGAKFKVILSGKDLIIKLDEAKVAVDRYFSKGIIVSYISRNE
jgi:Fe2+ transport system protein FeoA